MRYTNYFVFKKDLDSKGIEYAARHTKELGFDSVEFLDFYTPDHPILPERIEIDEAQRVLRNYGLDVACFSVGINLLELGRKNSINVLAKYGEAAARLGAPFLHHTLVFPLNLPENAPSYDDILDGIVETASEVAEKCAKLNVTCIYEPQGMYFNGVSGLGGFFDRMKPIFSNVGICGDVGNSIFVDIDPKEVFDAFSSEIKHVHIKDYIFTPVPIDGLNGYVSRGGRYIYESELGKGSVDIGYCLDKLKKAGYDGSIAFEFEAPDDEMKRKIAFIKNMLE